jgi:hypothetical protein
MLIIDKNRTDMYGQQNIKKFKKNPYLIESKLGNIDTENG